MDYCIGYIDYEKAFHSIEHETISKALRTKGINETYITILKDIYIGASAGVHMDDKPLPSDDSRLERLDPKGCLPLSCKSHPSYHEWNKYRWRKIVGPMDC